MKKCVIFKDIFQGLSRTLSLNYQDFPGPRIFKNKNPGLSRRHGNSVHNSGGTQLLHYTHNQLSVYCNLIEISGFNPIRQLQQPKQNTS